MSIYITVPLVYILYSRAPILSILNSVFIKACRYLPVYYAQISTLLLLLTKKIITRYSVNECQCLIKRNSACFQTL